jgi:uncharacterized protein (DUF1697 family)
MTSSAHRYIALLRAINVGGHSGIRMTDLRALFEACSLSDVVTYIQSGNVLFTTAEADRERLAHELQERLESSLGYATRVFVLTRDDLEAAVAHNPFDAELHEDGQLGHLVFLSDEPDASRLPKLMALQGEEYRFHVWGKVLYYAYPRALAGIRRSINFEKVLGVAGTARTWKVVNKLIELAA